MTNKEKMELALNLLKEFDQLNERDFETMFDDAILALEELLEQYDEKEINEWK